MSTTAKQQPLESNFNTGAAPDNTAGSARTLLSNQFVDTMRAASGNTDAVTTTNPTASGVIEAAVGTAVGANRGNAEVVNGTESGPNIDKAHLKDLLNQKPTDIHNAIGNTIKVNRDVTKEDREAAKAKLADGLSELIPEADREAMKNLQSAIIDGDMDKLKATLQELSKDPAKLAQFVKELNSQLDKSEKFGGIDLATDSQGNVLLYEENGSTAVSINPATGETTVKAIEKQADGSILLKPGEVLNRTAADVMKAVSDSATRSITDLGILRAQPKPPWLDGGPGHPGPRPMPMPVPMPMPNPGRPPVPGPGRPFDIKPNFDFKGLLQNHAEPAKDE